MFAVVVGEMQHQLNMYLFYLFTYSCQQESKKKV